MTVDWKLSQAEEVFINLSEDSEITNFLNHQKKSTRNTYSAYMRRLKEFTNETGQEILAELTYKKQFQGTLAEKAIVELLLDIREQNESNNGKKKAAMLVVLNKLRMG
ncbi:MAG: hypothetical protein ABSF44_00790 [Candidatus Bathyarchaeia archaeon]|jgi:poly-D-alanine transfer protein DltD